MIRHDSEPNARAGRSGRETPRLAAPLPLFSFRLLLVVRHRILTIAMLGMLAACAHEPPPQVAAPAPVQVARRAPPVKPVPRPSRKPAAPAREDVAANKPAAIAESPPNDPPPGPSAALPPAPAEPALGPGLDQLIGLDRDSATAMLGRATEEIERSPAVIWRYKTSACELNLFFYRDGRSGKERTLHYGFKGQINDSIDKLACLRAVTKARSHGGSAV